MNAIPRRSDTVGERVKLVREALGLYQDGFAEMVSASQASISRCEKGHSAPTQEFLAQVAALAQAKGRGEFTFSWLLLGRDVPHYEIACAWVLGRQDRLRPRAMAPVVLDSINPDFPNLAAFVVPGNLWHAVWDEDTVVFFDADADHHPPSRLLRRLCVVTTPNGRRAVKRLMAGSAPNNFTLVSLDPDVEDVVDTPLIHAQAIVRVDLRPGLL